MTITRSIISCASVLAVFAGSVSPAFAYRRAEPPVATTTLRQRSDIRELYADAFSSILELANMHRSAAVSDTTGRSMLARAQVRAAQRNYRRHVLGYLRGVDYRVLNVSGDSRRNVASRGLPFSLVQTGGQSDENYGSWGYNRPTRRAIRDRGYYGCTDNRNRDVFSC